MTDAKTILSELESCRHKEDKGVLVPDELYARVHALISEGVEPEPVKASKADVARTFQVELQASANDLLTVLRAWLAVEDCEAMSGEMRDNLLKHRYRISMLRGMSGTRCPAYTEEVFYQLEEMDEIIIKLIACGRMKI